VSLHFFRCRSFIGRIRTAFQPQGLILGPGCLVFSVVVHEIGHALGFFHEHSRPDRDDYIQVNRGNVIRGFESEFDIIPAEEVTTLGIGYDYASIMHYGPTVFGRPNLVTLQALDSNIPLGNAEEISPLDAEKTNRLYRCSK